MSPKKKKSSRLHKKPKVLQSRKEDAAKEKIKEKSRRRLIPFTAGSLPSVSKAMPQAASAVPLVSREVSLVSKPVSLVSAVPNVTIPKQWGIMPSKKWGVSKIRATRKRSVKRPKDIGVFNFLGKVITAPYQPVEMVKGLTSAIHSQAQSERDPKAALEQELLELKMRREMNEVSQEDYEIGETKIKRRIRNLKNHG